MLNADCSCWRREGKKASSWGGGMWRMEWGAAGASPWHGPSHVPGPSTVLQEREAPSQQRGAIEEIRTAPVQPWLARNQERAGPTPACVVTLMENSIKNEVSHCPVLQQDEAENRAGAVRREEKPDLWDMETYSNQGLKLRSNSFF